MGRPTMSDVAAEAHVSVKTVARVLRGDPVVSAGTAERVRAVIDRIGFQRRGEAARALQRGRTFTIGLVLEDLANPFYSQLSAAVEREARMRHYQLMTASAEGSATRERAVIEGMMARRVDGIIVVPADGDATVSLATEPSLPPIVFVDRPVRGLDADMVLSDNEGGVRSAVEHLAAHGHRRIGFLGDDPSFWTARQRREAFRTTHHRLGLPGPVAVSMGPHTPETVRAQLESWLGSEAPVTALLTGNNRVTLATLLAMRRLGVTLAIVGYDDFELAELLNPPVTVVHQDPAAMGQRAAQQLFVRVSGDSPPPQQFVIPTRLLVRSSTLHRSRVRDQAVRGAAPPL